MQMTRRVFVFTTLETMSRIRFTLKSSLTPPAYKGSNDTN